MPPALTADKINWALWASVVAAVRGSGTPDIQDHS
jgi:hypothetical protein